MDDDTIDPQAIILDSIQSYRKIFNDCKLYLETYFSTWETAWLQVYQFSIQIEDNIISNIIHKYPQLKTQFKIESRNNWEILVNKYSNSYYIWKEYINWSKNQNQTIDEIKKLYRRMFLSLSIDYSNEISNEWLFYDYFNNNSINEIFDTIHKVNGEIHKKQSVVTAKIAEETKKTNNKTEKGQKRLLNDENKSEIVSQQTIKSINMEESIKKRQKIEIVDNNNRNNKNTISNSSIIELAATSDTTDTSVEMTENNQIESPITKYYIFIKNLSFKTAIETITLYFQSCGEIISTELVLSKAGQSRGLAYIQFQNEINLNNALLLNKTILDERIIEIEKSNGPPNQSDLITTNSIPKDVTKKSKTVFVSKFSKSYNNNELKLLLEKNIGEILAVKIAYDKKTGDNKVSQSNLNGSIKSLICLLCFSFSVQH